MRKLIIITLAIIAVAYNANAQRLPSPKLPPQILNPRPGYINITEFNYGIGLSEINVPYSAYHFGLTTVNGYQINRFFIVGAGTGVLFYNDGFLVPLYLQGRLSYPVVNRKTAPYANAEGGALLNFEDFGGGTRLFINPMVGVRYTLSQTVALNLSTGLFMQMGPAKTRDSFLNFKLGVLIIPINRRY
ncbi:MAG: hypothetical protein HPY62_08695 [Bacteroidales bacterium]|nr:hypothetical protein [Bacteroidales bacterium]